MHPALFFLLATALQGTAPTSLSGQLAVSPERVLFQGRSRTQELSLTNPGAVPATYRLDFQCLAMGEDGRLHQVESLPRNAAPLLRLSSRQVTLQPGERQTVRIILRKPSDLPEGDHRIHLRMQAIPTPDPLPNPTEIDSGIQVHLRPLPAIAVPIHVRHGQVQPAFQIEELAWTQKKLGFTVRMTGNATLAGTLRVRYQPQASSRLHPVTQIEGFVHYADLPRQRVTVTAEAPDPRRSGHLHVDLLNEEGHPIASAALPLATHSNPT